MYYPVFVLFVVFFQAEDGIRDLVRSRGLGDVYKRQPPDGVRGARRGRVGLEVDHAVGAEHAPELVALAPVSYTHLTLPTSDLV